jgi:hypothetical protein
VTGSQKRSWGGSLDQGVVIPSIYGVRALSAAPTPPKRYPPLNHPVNAFKKRHSYGATDNIIVDVRCGDQIMGDRFTTSKRPTLEIRVTGTAPIAKVQVVRDNKYVYSAEPKEGKVSLRYTDMDAKEGKSSYYYVRVEQSDGNLAWASPMWITYQP